MIKRKLSCYIYGEGAKDKAFLLTLFSLEKFQFHTKKWNFQYGNASGGSAKTIAEKCHRESSGPSFDLVLCFIDLDKLKHDFPKKWLQKKEELEQSYPNIHFIWQIDNAEDEYKRALGKLGDSCKGKHQLNKMAKAEIKKFINSSLWKRILKPIKRIIG